MLYICFILTGVYKIDVLQGSRPVRGSPYHCQVFDATKVKLEKLAANSVSVNENISFKCKLNFKLDLTELL